MNQDEYRAKLAEVRERHKAELEKLTVEYIMESQPLSVGDFATDHIGTIMVEDIMPCGTPDHPNCIYFGLQYTKAGKPFKSGAKRKLYRCNLESHKKSGE